MFPQRTLAGLLLLAAAPIASANTIDYLSYLLDKATIRTNTYLGAWSYSFEDEQIEAAYKKYQATQASANIPLIGQPAIYAIAGVPQSPGFPDVIAGPGSLLSIDFGFVDPATGLAASGPAIGSVEYLVSTDPNNPLSYTPIGTSTDAASNFSFSYLDNSAYEPDIEAIPFDLSGHPIVLTGVDGYNAAIGSVTALSAAPEPSAWLFLAGVIFMAPWLMRKKQRSDQSRC
jgi:hypothetical protein